MPGGAGDCARVHFRPGANAQCGAVIIRNTVALHRRGPKMHASSAVLRLRRSSPTPTLIHTQVVTSMARAYAVWYNARTEPCRRGRGNAIVNPVV